MAASESKKSKREYGVNSRSTWTSRIVGLLLASLVVVSQVGCGGGGGGSDGGTGGSTGAGDPPSVQASLQELGVRNLRLNTLDGKVHVLEGSQASALVSFELDSGIDPNDLAWTPADGSRGVDVQQAGGRVVAVVSGGTLAAGTEVLQTLKVTNAMRGLYANFAFKAVVIAANTVAVGTVNAAGGSVGTGSTIVTILPNGLKQAVGVKVIEGPLANGEPRFAVPTNRHEDDQSWGTS